MQDTIYAFATPVGMSALAVVRLSGPQCLALANGLLRRPLEPRKAELVRIQHPLTHDLVDQAIALWFPGPASFSGEDCLELHIHGGRAVRQAVSDALSFFPDVRVAEPGEFVKRAFLNGKMDLAELEGLGDLLSAQTETQRRLAWVQAGGSLHKHCNEWRQLLLEAISLLEATIDFADEDDTPASVVDSVADRLERLSIGLGAQIDNQGANEIIREGLCVAIIGEPNVGKSSLLNALAQRDVAIVSDEPGTTRDVLEVSLDVGGRLIRLQDTAGIRETSDKVEALGIERSGRAAEAADLILYLQDQGRAKDPLVEHYRGKQVIVVNTKCDLVAERNAESIWISSLTGDGIPALLEAMAVAIGQTSSAGTDSVIVNQRQLGCIQSAANHLDDARQAIADDLPEIVCEHLRLASSALNALTGKIGTEDVLGEIFSRFCIGK